MSQVSFNKYAEASLSGATRGLIGLPIEHPFDVSKTYWQANPQLKSSFGVAQAIYRRGGILAFYSGAIPNGIRLVTKQTYRWPLMLTLPQFFEHALPERTQKAFPTSKKVCTAFVIANLEVGIITPLERFKVWYITQNPGQKKIKYLFSTEKSSGVVKICFKGLNTVWARQVVSWTSFLVADAKFKAIERKKYPDQKELPFLPLMKVSTLVGVVNTACNMPFDVAKTHLQKAGSKANKGVVSTMQQIVRKHGYLALYRGWPIRMAQYIIQSAFTVPLLEKLERKWQ